VLSSTTPNPQVLDPQVDTWYDSNEIYRCCLLRTLFSYKGSPTSQGGSILQPDLAAGEPDVSADGLSWTIHLKRGIHYSPPLANLEVTTADIVRALERTAKLQGPGVLPITGFDDYAKGKVTSISGLSTPDAYTLKIELTQPAGDLGYLLSVGDTAPIPPLPGSPTAELGAATGHDDGYGRFLVATGPYMIAGSEALNFRLPAAQQQRVAGLVPGRSLTLVRNPSWSAATDSLRPANADRIVLTIEPSLDQAGADVDSNRQDLIMLSLPSLQAPEAEIQAYQRNSSLGHVDIEPRDFARYISINLAIPPLDDVNVRMAISLVIDKSALVGLHGGPQLATPTGHFMLDSLEGNALLGYDPYRTSGDHGDLSAAMAAMRASSRYDPDHDGICDGPVCQGLTALVFANGTFPAEAMSIAHDLKAIGLGLDIKRLPGKQVFSDLSDPMSHTALGLDIGWGKDFPNGTDFFGLFSSQVIGSGDYSLTGASPQQLSGWGYSVTHVPSLDDRINYCESLIDNQQASCWTSMDKYVMTQVVPIVPVYDDTQVEVVPARVGGYTFDQFTCLPALDHIYVTT